MTFLKEQSETKQIIISTHVPKSLDILNTDELDHIQIIYYDYELGTQASHLNGKQSTKAKGYTERTGFLVIIGYNKQS